ncbi:MAG: hypothetical protein IPM35_16680 [Myxococcales bacterium]|nr:hypothetical protein [Myxococcales bacterium]
MTDLDVQAFAAALNQNYVQFVSSSVAPLAREGRSVAAVDYRSAPTYFAVCNTTNIRVAFDVGESPETVARRLWAAVQQAR